MKSISDSDLKAVVRFLGEYASEAKAGEGTSKRNARRLAGVLARKLSKKV